MQKQYVAPAARTVPLWFVHDSFEVFLRLVQAPGEIHSCPGSHTDRNGTSRFSVSSISGGDAVGLSASCLVRPLELMASYSR